MGKVGKTIKWGFLLLLLILWLLIAFNWELVSYGVAQGRGQLKIVWEAKPVDQFLQDPQFPDSLKEKLELIDEVRRFAIDSLSLKDTENYKTLFDQKGEEIMWVVTASERYLLKPKEWKFPILGAVPYKGFFNKEKALALAQELDKDGWDVSVRNPGGWSTLGWFRDPVLSKMLERSEGDLASLIIHEMVHATIFVKDSVDFNENLASFIGDRGAEQFLISKYGRDAEQYIQYIHEDRDYIKYVNHVLRGTKSLDSLYLSMVDEPIAIKEQRKSWMIGKIIQTLDTLSLSSGKRPSERFKDKLPNNAYFMSFIHYQSGQEELWMEWEQTFDGNLRQYIKYLTSKYPFL